VSAEQERAMCLAYKRAHREHIRRQDRLYRLGKRVPCPWCSRPMEPDSHHCRRCHEEMAEIRRDIVVGLYEAGWKLKEIAEVFGITVNNLGQTIDRLRKAGRLGHRYRMGANGYRLPNRAPEEPDEVPEAEVPEAPDDDVDVDLALDRMRNLRAMAA
jgi:DNA-directed RNA polymerase specialized sigma24 family protein